VVLGIFLFGFRAFMLGNMFELFEEILPGKDFKGSDFGTDDRDEFVVD